MKLMIKTIGASFKRIQKIARTGDTLIQRDNFKGLQELFNETHA